MMLLSLLHGLQVIQIPVNYLPRVGESSVTGDLRKAFLLGLWMIGLVCATACQLASANAPRAPLENQPHHLRFHD